MLAQKLLPMTGVIVSAPLRLKARLRPMRGLKRDRTARVILAGHAFVQNLRRGFYDLGTDVRPTGRPADAFAELALVI
jgi:IS6 family transposase